MTEDIKVSVIFATYNRASIIEDVLKQWLEVDRATKYAYEIICSDDASSDNTVELIEQFEGLPITRIRNEHGGASRARNAALKIAKGDIVIFTGDDIFPEPEFVNRHYENYLKFGDKVCTLGRIEWHKDLTQNHLMQHITNIGCEQFGFAGLIPYALTDFRHFYTSNISVSRKELDSLDKYFDLTFDRYGFEDIELGYRLFENGVMIYYDPELLVYHHHIYDDVDKFCNRQMSAGNQLVVFSKLHDEVRYNEVMGIYKYEEVIDSYINADYEESQRGKEILSYTDILKNRTRELEELISKEDKNVYRAECSAIYRYIFQLSMYLGWGLRMVEEKGVEVDESVIAEAAFDYMYTGYSQLFVPQGRRYSEEDSYMEDKRGLHVRVEQDIEGANAFRFDPYNLPCIVANPRAKAIDEYGKIKELKLKNANGTGANKLDFSNSEDPQMYYSGLVASKKYHVCLDMDVYAKDDIKSKITDMIEDEKESDRDYKKTVSQKRRLNICIVNSTDEDISEVVDIYRQLVMLIYNGEVILSNEVVDYEFYSNYIYEIIDNPMPYEMFLMVLRRIYDKDYEGLCIDTNNTIYMGNLTKTAKEKLKKYNN